MPVDAPLPGVSRLVAGSSPGRAGGPPAVARRRTGSGARFLEFHLVTQAPGGRRRRAAGTERGRPRRTSRHPPLARAWPSRPTSRESKMCAGEALNRMFDMYLQLTR